MEGVGGTEAALHPRIVHVAAAHGAIGKRLGRVVEVAAHDHVLVALVNHLAYDARLLGMLAEGEPQFAYQRVAHPLEPLARAFGLEVGHLDKGLAVVEREPYRVEVDVEDAHRVARHQHIEGPGIEVVAVHRVVGRGKALFHRRVFDLGVGVLRPYYLVVIPVVTVGIFLLYLLLNNIDRLILFYYY